MADLGNRANVNSAIDLLLDDLQPDEAIQPSDHNVLLKDILDTLANGLSTVLRTANTTDGQNLTITSSSIFQFANGSNGRLQSDTLTAFRNWTLPDATGTIALLSDIPSSVNIYTADGTLTGNRTVSSNGNDLTFDSSSSYIAEPFTVLGYPYLGAGTKPYLKVKAYGEVEILGRLTDIFTVKNSSGSKILDVNNGNVLVNGSFTISASYFKVVTTVKAMNFYQNGGTNLLHDIQTGIGFPDKVRFNMLGGTSQFIVGGSAVIGSERISLQGSTAIKGIGTSGSSALAIYDNDTTPIKLWDFLDNGDLNGSNNRITNTIVNPSVQGTTSTANFTINADEETTGVLTAIALATTIASPTGTPVQGQKLTFRFKDNGTAQSLTWNAIFRAIGLTLPTTTTANKTIYIGCMYNSTETKWDVIAIKEEV